MKGFNNVKRYDTEDVRVGEMPWETCRADMWESESGEYVEYQDYKDLLDAYTEIKFILDGLH